MHYHRYATCIAALVFVTVIQSFTLYAAVFVRNVRRRPVWLLFALTSLLVRTLPLTCIHVLNPCAQNVVSVYHIVVMRLQTTSLTSMAPGSLNSTASKTTFYIFNIAPEWITVAVLHGLNVRETFETGLYGDHLRPKEKDMVRTQETRR